MVDVPPERVADAMHTDGVSDLPTGYAEDITSAEYLIEEYVEPHATDDQSNAVETAGVYVAAAFIGGTEGAAPLASIDRESAALEFDIGNMSPEARDFWARATMVDPTGRLKAASEGTTAFSFDSLGSQSGQGYGNVR